MEVIDITLRHLDLRQLRLGGDDDTAAEGQRPPGLEEPTVSHETAGTDEDDVVVDVSLGYTTAWQLPAEV